MRLAARHGAVAVNPVREVNRIERKPARRPRSLTEQERRQWLEAVEADHRAVDWDLPDLPDLTRMMLATGCRIGECLAIGWCEVDLGNAAVDVAWHLVPKKGVGLLRLPSTKSGAKGERLIPFPTWAVTMLRQRRARIGDGIEPVFRTRWAAGATRPTCAGCGVTCAARSTWTGW
jgi:integrase